MLFKYFTSSSGNRAQMLDIYALFERPDFDCEKNIKKCSKFNCRINVLLDMAVKRIFGEQNVQRLAEKYKHAKFQVIFTKPPMKEFGPDYDHSDYSSEVTAVDLEPGRTAKIEKLGAALSQYFAKFRYAMHENSDAHRIRRELGSDEAFYQFLGYYRGPLEKMMCEGAVHIRILFTNDKTARNVLIETDCIDHCSAMELKDQLDLDFEVTKRGQCPNCRRVEIYQEIRKFIAFDEDVAEKFGKVSHEDAEDGHKEFGSAMRQWELAFMG